jgi:hypothetical protein
MKHLPFEPNINAMAKVLKCFEAKYGYNFNSMSILKMRETITPYEWQRWATAFKKGIDIGELQ